MIYLNLLVFVSYSNYLGRIVSDFSWRVSVAPIKVIACGFAARLILLHFYVTVRIAMYLLTWMLNKVTPNINMPVTKGLFFKLVYIFKFFAFGTGSKYLSTIIIANWKLNFI